jgi:PadR family transcriptional regulator, regulatory protein PadR
MTRDRLGELEYGLLFALVACGDGANGRALRAELARRTGHEVSAGACYTTLERLEAKGKVTSWLGESTPARGGRRSRAYALEPAGARALLQTHEQMAAAAAGLLPALRRHVPQQGRS